MMRLKTPAAVSKRAPFNDDFYTWQKTSRESLLKVYAQEQGDRTAPAALYMWKSKKASPCVSVAKAAVCIKQLHRLLFYGILSVSKLFSITQYTGEDGCF